LQEGIFDVAIDDSAKRIAASAADGLTACWDESGKRLWSVHLPSHAALAFLGDVLVAGDASGCVRYFNANGKVIEQVDLAQRMERPLLRQELINPDPETLSTIRMGLPRWQERPAPPGKPNLALAAKVDVKAPPGWYSIGVVENEPGVLNNGKADDVDEPWLSLHELYWDASAQRLPQMTITFDKPQTVQALVVREHSAHAGVVPSEIAIEARQDDGSWKTVCTALGVAGVVHTHHFQPVTTTALRYTVVADLFDNLWTTEVEAY
ncbi:MAG TPA: hypothetical protein VM186_15645, partial [Planctomycetota bacterium]|nr:hypothetical protein [Planctomycetota bacterium]